MTRKIILTPFEDSEGQEKWRAEIPDPAMPRTGKSMCIGNTAVNALGRLMKHRPYLFDVEFEINSPLTNAVRKLAETDP